MEQRFGFLLLCLQLLRKNSGRHHQRCWKYVKKTGKDSILSKCFTKCPREQLQKCGQTTAQHVECTMSSHFSVPEDTFVNLTENFLNSERNQGLQFTRSNKLKIGFNCLSNHLQKISFFLRNNSLQDSNVVFKMKCKKLFITDELAKF